MRQLVTLFSFLLLLVFAACTGSGTASDYFTPGITTTPPTLEAAEGDVRGVFTAISSYAYGRVTVPTNATFTLKNVGDYNAKLTRTSFGSDQFSFLGGSYPGTGGTCATTVSSNATCTIIVQFVPVVNQSITALMTIYYDSREGETALEITLSGGGGSTPTISAITPSSGLVAGGTAVTITGTGFLSGLSVLIGGSSCTGVSVINATRLSCVTPAHASGAASVVVTNSDGERATYANGYYYITAPALAAISDQTVNEGVAIAQVNANDGGDDFDADGEAITYTCYYDTTADGVVAVPTTCASLSGSSFTAATGVFDWTPALATAGTYEIKITGSDGTLSDDEIFVVTVSAVSGWNETKLTASDGAVTDYFGRSVAISGTTAVIGAYGDASGIGSAYLFRFDPSSNTWMETKLTASDGALSDLFGFSVAISGTTAVIGAHGGASNTGSAYVYQFDPSSNAWGETKLTASDGAVNDNYGRCVAVSGTTAVIGAWGDAGRTGSAYVYQFDPSSNTWAETKLTASDGGVNDWFGFSVAISGTTAVIGAYADANFTGSAYVYRFDPSSNTWMETKLTASDGAVSDAFGYSVAISGTTAIIGAYNDASGTGSAYLFRFDPSSNTWMETKLTASDGTVNDIFGDSVAISGTTAIIGAHGDASSTGSAYIYKHPLPASETKLTASDGAAGDSFGLSAAISGSTVVIGSYGDASNTGAAYLYQFDPSSNTWAETKLTASDGAVGDSFGFRVAISGTTAVIGAWGDASFTGSAYLYQFDPSSNTWLETKLTASDGAVNNRFGASAAISGNTVVIGAWGDASLTGLAYLYQLDSSSNTWMETKLTASDGAVSDRFGFSVAISGTTAVIGAPGDASFTGSAYLYRFDSSSNTWAETKLTASDGGASDSFGDGVAVSGTTVVVGADADARGRGAVYIYQFDPSSNTWAETKLTASDGAVSDRFGFSVAISGTTAVIGAYGDAGYTGSAYLYQFDPSSNTWLETKLTASDGAGFDQFGCSVAISGTTAVIGAFGDASNTGSAYLYGF